MGLLFNGVRVACSTIGDGPLVLGAAVPGWLSFQNAAVPNGSTVTYTIREGLHFEVGIGVYSSIDSTLTRELVYSSTNSNARISLHGSAEVAIDAAAQSFNRLPNPTGNFGVRLKTDDVVSANRDLSFRTGDANRLIDLSGGNVVSILGGAYPTSDVASAATCDIGASNTPRVRITGTTTITSLGSQANRLRHVQFADALSITHNAVSLILPGSDNILTEAGDTAIFSSDASGNWTCLSYTRRRQRPRGNLLSDFAINLFADSGRFAGNSAATEYATTFAMPNYITLYNGATAANYGKFITNNNDYGGAAGALATEVKSLIDKVKDSSYRRYGVEFFVGQITAGSGTATTPIVVGGTTFYNNAFLAFGPRPPAMTFRAHIRALDAAIAYRVWAGQTAFKNGVRQSGNFRIETSDGWTHVLVFDEQAPRTSVDYSPNPYSIYCASSGHRYLIACPALMGGLVEVDSNVLAVPSVNRWLV